MISVSNALRKAITADARRTRIKCVVDIVGPDIVYGTVTAQSKAPWSVDEQIHNKILTSESKYATLEHNRWLLDGTFDLYPDDYTSSEETGVVSETISGSGGTFSTPQYVELQFTGVYILQACTVYFSNADGDGVPRDFTISVYSNGTAYFSQSFTENTETSVYVDGFTVYRPDAIRVTVTRMSSASRRVRVLEIVPGYYEEWTEEMLSDFSITQQASFSGLALPYGTCRLRMDNLDRRFEPRKKGGMFQSLEDRQGIEMYLGADTENGIEYVPVGLYYQYNSGWKTGDNDITMQWDLVDIIGLLTNRVFKFSGELPTTLGGWAAALVAQLGPNFEARFSVDPDYENLPCTVTDVSAVEDKTCGQILLWICQATETWPRADAETGKLTIEPFWSQGVTLSLDNLEKYPVMRANEDIARLDFTLSDGSQTSYTGTSAAAPRNANISNPFLHTIEAAEKTARMILSAYGGNQIETTGRGDYTSEIGDVATVELDKSSATTGRVMFQTFQFSSGVLRGCKTTLLQADGSYLFQQRVFLTGSGTWTAPAGVTQIRVVLGQGGQGGGHGTDGVLGYTDSVFNPPVDGEDGADGVGGKVFYSTFGINPQESFVYSVGDGGAAGANPGDDGAMGGESTFGTLSSANGEIYPNGFTDIANGDSYGRSAVVLPLANSGDGAKGGTGGEAGYAHTETNYDSEGNPHGSYRVIDKEPTPGSPGADGGSGFIIVYYDLPEG